VAGKATADLNENFKPDEKVHSQYKPADMFNINPVTAAKGLTLLFDENFLYNKRGLANLLRTTLKIISTMSVLALACGRGMWQPVQ